MTSSVLGSSFDNGQRSPNYFNGRLVTAEDFQAEQEAVLTREHWLGRAVGAGVVQGMRVTAGAGSVTVASGLGVNAKGTPLRVPTAVTLAVSPTTAGSPPVAGGRFADCAPPSPGGPAAISSGAYLLTVMPASRFEGLAPSQAAAGSSLTPACASRWEVQGLAFKAIRLDFPVTSSGATPANRRNLLAHWCFGSKALTHLAEDPFHFGSDFTGLDTVPPSDLGPCDLPLAVFWWTGTAIEFLDNWSARRRVTRPDPDSGWSGLLSDTRVAIGQARFLQFQERVDQLVSTGAAGNTVASTVFGLLPPVGFLPLKPASLVARLDAMAGLGKIRKPTTQPRPIGAVARSATAVPVQRGAAAYAKAYNQQVAIAPEVLELGDAFGILSDKVQELEATIAVLAATPGRDAPPPPSKARSDRQAKRAKALMAEVNELRAGLVAAQGFNGFDLVTFFGSLPRRIGVVDRETIDFTLQRSWFDEALDPSTGADINIFVVRDSLGKKTVQPYVMFAKALQPIRWIAVGPRKG